MTGNKRYIIFIDDPCHEDWDRMSPMDCGRFCNSCNKEVHDLTGFSEEALQTWASKQKTPVCGRLNSGQLGNPADIRTSPKKKRLYKMVAAFLATTSLSSVLSVNAQKTSGKSSFRTEQGAASLKPALQDGDSLKYKIQGSVTDSVSKNPLAGVSIFIGGRVMGITDTDGRYSFIVPLEYRKPIVEITAEKMGSHEPVKDIIRLKKLPAELNFILTVYECKSTVIISSGIIVIKPVEDKSGAASKREPWYRKMLNRPAR